MSTILVNNIKSYTGTTVTVSGSNVLVTGNTTLGDGAGNDTITVRGHLTASGNISASGTIYADAFESATGGSTISFNDNTDIVGVLGITGSRIESIYASGTDTGHAGFIGIDSSGSILPGANNLFDLGRGNRLWAEVFASTVITSYIKPTAFGSVSPLGVSGSIESSGSITPSADDKWDLGSSNKQWRNLYIDGVAEIDSLTSAYAIVGNITSSGAIFNPHNSLYVSLGSPTKLFKDAYLDSASINVLTLGAGNVEGYVSSSLLPYMDDAHDLGKPSKQWRNLYIDGIAHIDSASINEVATNLIPNRDYALDLGSSGKEWQDVHADTLVTGFIKPAQHGSPLPGNMFPLGISGSVRTSGSITPHADDAFDLGSSALQWKDLYVDGTANIDTLTGVANATITTASFTTLSSSLIPLADDAFDLGSSTLQWKDLYVDGTANIDSAVIELGTIVSTVTSQIASRNNEPLGISGSIVSSGSIVPSHDDKWDLGSSNKEWNDLYIDGVAHIDAHSLPTSEAGAASNGLFTLSGSQIFSSSAWTSGHIINNATSMSKFVFQRA